MLNRHSIFFFFFFNDTATTEIYTLSLHDALPISRHSGIWGSQDTPRPRSCCSSSRRAQSVHRVQRVRSEEHMSELQSQSNLVCRLLLEKKKIKVTHCDTNHLRLSGAARSSGTVVC